MSAAGDKLTKLIKSIEAVDALLKRELPDVRVYPTPSLDMIWQGLGQIRMQVVGTLNSFITSEGDGWAEERQDYWMSIRDSYINSISALLPYGKAINEMVAKKQPNVTFTGYGFKSLLSQQLAKTKTILIQAQTTLALQQIFGSGNVFTAIYDGIVKIYNGVKLVVGTALNIAGSLIDGFGFLFKNWIVLAAGAAYLIWFRKSKA